MLNVFKQDLPITNGTPFMNLYASLIDIDNDDELSAVLLPSGTENQRGRPKILLLPPRAWRSILKHLPFSQVPALALVCKDFRDLVYINTQYWIYFYEQRKLVGPADYNLPTKRMTTEYQQNLLRKHYAKLQRKLCDSCFGRDNLTIIKHGWMSVLPVAVYEYNNNVSNRNNQNSNSPQVTKKYEIFLCGSCRKTYYQHHPLQVSFSTDAGNRVLSTKELSDEFGLTKAVAKGMPAPRTARKGLCFAREIYGGDVGIQAERMRRKYGGGGTSAVAPGTKVKGKTNVV